MFDLVPNTQCIWKYGRRKYLVTAMPVAGQYDCECCKWYRDGLLCCHILKVLTHIGVDEIPEHYIKR